jgi:hypothetical protein
MTRTNTVLVLRDSRGERHVRVIGECHGRLAVRNIQTNRLSYVHSNDVRIVRHRHEHAFSDDAVKEAQALMGRLGMR